MSLFPYLAFLYYLTRSGQTPRLTLFGFYFLLVFVGATIPAGIYAKVHYGTSLANVDWLHGAAESLLTITNLLIVLGLRGAIRDEEAKKRALGPDPVVSTPEAPSKDASPGPATSPAPLQASRPGADATQALQGIGRLPKPAPAQTPTSP